MEQWRDLTPKADYASIVSGGPLPDLVYAEPAERPVGEYVVEVGDGYLRVRLVGPGMLRAVSGVGSGVVTGDFGDQALHIGLVDEDDIDAARVLPVAGLPPGTETVHLATLETSGPLNVESSLGDEGYEAVPALAEPALIEVHQSVSTEDEEDLGCVDHHLSRRTQPRQQLIRATTVVRDSRFFRGTFWFMPAEPNRWSWRGSRARSATGFRQHCQTASPTSRSKPDASDPSKTHIVMSRSKWLLPTPLRGGVPCEHAKPSALRVCRPHSGTRVAALCPRLC
jgi:hypothetical protein